MRRALTVLSLALVAVTAAYLWPTSTPPPTLTPTTASVLPRYHMLHLINVQRTNRGLHPVHMTESLVPYARRHSQSMARQDLVFHTSCLACHLTSYTWRIAGEAVGAGGKTVLQMLHAFMRSTEHRRIILRPGYRHAGISMVRARGVLWATMIFYG